MALFLSQHFVEFYGEIYSKYIIKAIFIHKNQAYVMLGRSGMVPNVDFLGVRALEPLKSVLTSKNRNLLF